MDGHRFDGLVKVLAATGSRRRALGLLLGGALAAAPGALVARRRWRERRIIRIIHRAADRYNQNGDAMVKVARCESNLDPYAVSPDRRYHGLFQFLRSTFRDTPYGNEDIYDPKANALAAAWKWERGERNEWVC